MSKAGGANKEQLAIKFNLLATANISPIRLS